ncbi:MAG: hypothetical protein ACR2QZ_03560 [Woeseiaceae bacterium]
MTDRRLFAGRAIALLLALMCVAPSQADEWVMPGLTTQWIARDMDINGVPASMRTVRGARSLDEVLRYYRHHWAGAIDERVEGEWHVVATRQHEQFVSLRLQQFGTGVRGVLTTSLNPGVASPGLQSTLPIPPGLTRLAHQSFRDDGARGENLTLMSPRGIAYERQAFATLYQSGGWVRVEDRATRAARDGHVLQFLRSKEHIRIVLYRDPELADGNTLILVTAHRD